MGFLINFSRYFGMAIISLFLLSGALWLFALYRLRIQKGEIDFSIKQLQIYLHIIGSPSLEINKQSVLKHAGKEVERLISERESLKPRLSPIPAREGDKRGMLSSKIDNSQEKSRDIIREIENLNHNIRLIGERIDIVKKQEDQEKKIKRTVRLFMQIAFFTILYCIFWWAGIKIFPPAESFLFVGAALSAIAIMALWFLTAYICSISWYVVNEEKKDYEPGKTLTREKTVIAGVVLISIFIFLLANTGIIEEMVQKRKTADNAITLLLFGYPVYLLYRLFGWVNRKILIEREGGQ